MRNIKHQCTASLLVGFLALLGVMIGGTPVQAVTFGFYNISNNSGIAAQLKPQLSVDVTDAGGQVNFQFHNAGGSSIASSITDIYFDDVSLFKSSPPNMVITNGPGVDFSQDASPGNLPGGNPLGFFANLSADSNSGQGENGVMLNGINLNETLTIALTLVDLATFDSVISALFAGTLRIGLHVQSIAGDASDSYISQTPLPGALPLFISGLAGLGFFRWLEARKPVTA